MSLYVGSNTVFGTNEKSYFSMCEYFCFVLFVYNVFFNDGSVSCVRVMFFKYSMGMFSGTTLNIENTLFPYMLYNSVNTFGVGGSVFIL